MGLFSRLAKMAATLNAPKPIQSRSSASESPQQMTFATGWVSPPALGEPVAIKLKTGKDVELFVNIRVIAEEVDRDLLGRAKDDEEKVEKAICLWRFSDLVPPYTDLVRVPNRKGKIVGWVEQEQSLFASDLIDQIGTSFVEHDPSLAGRSPKLKVSSRLFGTWLTELKTDDDGNVLEEKTRVLEVEAVSVTLSWPIATQSYGDDALK